MVIPCLVHTDVVPDLTLPFNVSSTMIFRKYCHLCEASQRQPRGSCGSHHRCAVSHGRHRQARGASVCHHQPSFSRAHRVHYTPGTGHHHLQPDGHSSQPCGLHARQPCQHSHRNLSVSLEAIVQHALELLFKAKFTLCLKLDQFQLFPRITQI